MRPVASEDDPRPHFINSRRLKRTWLESYQPQKPLNSADKVGLWNFFDLFQIPALKRRSLEPCAGFRAGKGVVISSRLHTALIIHPDRHSPLTLLIPSNVIRVFRHLN